MIPDPNKLLEDIRTRVNPPDEEAQEPPHYGLSLAELMAMLDEWLSKGGALPADWQPIGPEKK